MKPGDPSSQRRRAKCRQDIVVHSENLKKKSSRRAKGGRLQRANEKIGLAKGAKKEVAFSEEGLVSDH